MTGNHDHSIEPLETSESKPPGPGGTARYQMGAATMARTKADVSNSSVGIARRSS